jgi:hypothetical protein
MPETLEQELFRKVRNLVLQRFAGSYVDLFLYYSKKRTQTGWIDSFELHELLRDAGIGNAMTLPHWVSGVMAKIDQDRDGFISHVEFLWTERVQVPWLDAELLTIKPLQGVVDPSEDE